MLDFETEVLIALELYTHVKALSSKMTPRGPFGQFWSLFQRKPLIFRFVGRLELRKQRFGAISREAPVENYLVASHKCLCLENRSER